MNKKIEILFVVAILCCAFVVAGPETVYQEYADITECSDFSCDGSWETSAYSSQQVSYNKPKYASSAIWKIKDSCGTFELQVPENCWNYDKSMLTFAYLRGEGFEGNHYFCKASYGDCKDFGCEWNLDTSVMREVEGCGDLYEEAVVWTVNRDYQEHADETSCNSIMCDGIWDSNGVEYPITEQFVYNIPENYVGAVWQIGLGGTIGNYTIPDVCFVGKTVLELYLQPYDNDGQSTYDWGYHQFKCKDSNGMLHYVYHTNRLNHIREESIHWQRSRQTTRWDFAPNNKKIEGLNSNDNYGNPSFSYGVRFDIIPGTNNIGVANFSPNSVIVVSDKTWFDYTNGIEVSARFFSKQNNHRYLVYKHGVFLVQVTSANRLQAGIYTSNGRWQPLVNGPVIRQNRWYDIKFTYDNKNAKLYVNNKLYSSRSFSSALVDNNNNIYFGGVPGANRGFVGWMDYIQIKNI